ncbi:MAG: transporter [Rhizobacter sp.]|nr:transporter [Rhizobacter sp.]
MSVEVLLKLLAIFFVIGMGWIAGQTKLMGGREAARTLSGAAFYIFAPALLFRSTARIDMAAMQWSAIAAYFIPVVALMVAFYAWQRRRSRAADALRPEAPTPPASSGVRAITATFGNTSQLGIPLVASLYGEGGLSVLVTIIALHSLTLMTIITTLTELDVARERARSGNARSLASTLAVTARRTVIHPVVLPVLCGLAFNAIGLSIPSAIDGILVLLSQALVPVSLIAIGMSLAHFGLRGGAAMASLLAGVKLLLQPAVVYVAARWVGGLEGLTLIVVVLCSALPSGSNALMFAQGYETNEAETTAAIVLSTVAFVATAPLWLWLLGPLAR